MRLAPSPLAPCHPPRMPGGTHSHNGTHVAFLMREPGCVDVGNSSHYTAWVRDLLFLDAAGHHYGRDIERHAVFAAEDKVSKPDAAFIELARLAHSTLRQRLDDREFFAEAHRIIEHDTRLARRHHRRRGRPETPPPTASMTFAYFMQVHAEPSRPIACFPWWCGELYKPLPGDEPPNCPPAYIAGPPAT